MPRTPAHAVVALLALACAAAQAQEASSSPTTPAAGTSDSFGPDRIPFYVGVSETLTHTSNVFLTADAKPGWYSTTSLFGGTTARFGRQRLYGVANIGLDHYFDENRQDNTHYGVAAGLDWETIMRLAGNVEVGADRGAVAPPVGDDDPDRRRKRTQTSERISGAARWGGDAAITLELRGGYSRVGYSGSGNGSGDNDANTVSFGVFYRPGALLRLGVALRQNKTRTDDAIFDVSSSNFESNTVRSRNVDLLASYDPGGPLTVSGRLSYTKQDNSNGAADSDFSGLTGGLNLGYQVSGKISASAYASRDAGTNGTSIAYPVAPATPPSTGTPTTTPTPVPTSTGLYQSTQRTTSVGAGLSYAATARISANAGAGYSRQRLLRSVVDVDSPRVTDRQTSFYLGVNYAFARNWDTGCRYDYTKRDISRDAGDDYHVHAIGCRLAYTLR